MSHHADSPLALQAPQLDICALYVFRGTAGTVTALTVNPLSGPAGFDAHGQYCVHIDLDADCRPDITFRATFDPRVTFESEQDGVQQVRLQRIDGPQAADRDAPGVVVASGITETLIEGETGIRLWAGQAADPDWIHGGILDAAQRCIAAGTPFDPRDARRAAAINLLAWTNVHAVVIEIPDRMLGGAQLAVWSTTATRGPAGWQQLQRCALPLLNTLFPVDDPATGLDHNGTGPDQDRILYRDTIAAGAARAARALGTAADPGEHGARVADLLLPDVLPYRAGTAARFGLAAGNGRGLTCPAPERVISEVMAAPVPFGLDATSASGCLRAVFPYLSAPVALPGLPG